MNKTYIAMNFNNKDLNIETIYFTENFLNGDVVNPATQAKYTAEEKAALPAADLTAPEGAYIAISSFGPKQVLWFDQAAAAKIVSHTDALTVKGNSICTLDGQAVAEAM